MCGTKKATAPLSSGNISEIILLSFAVSLFCYSLVSFRVLDINCRQEMVIVYLGCSSANVVGLKLALLLKMLLNTREERERGERGWE